MGSLFDKAVAIILGHEGGESNDPDDPGGHTNLGVTQGTLDRARETTDIDLPSDVGNLKVTQAKEIYKTLYWDAVRADELPWPLNLYVFDAAVNQGVTVAIKLLQKAVDVAQDGIIGKRTVRAAAGASNWHTDRFMAFRAKRYFGTRNFDRFGDGWLIRTYAVARQGEKA